MKVMIKCDDGTKSAVRAEQVEVDGTALSEWLEKGKAAKADFDRFKKATDETIKELREEIHEGYYSKWRIVFACDSIVSDWQNGIEGVGGVLKAKAEEIKAEALSSSEASCESLLTDDQVKSRYQRIFGRAL